MTDRRPVALRRAAEAVAVAGYRGLMRGKRVVVPGLMNRLVVEAMRFVPRGVLLGAIGCYDRGRLQG